jgi:hypothetical protein
VRAALTAGGAGDQRDSALQWAARWLVPHRRN